MCGALFSCSYCPIEYLGRGNPSSLHEETRKVQERLKIIKSSETFQEFVREVHRVVNEYAKKEGKPANSHISPKACERYCLNEIQTASLHPTTFKECTDQHGDLSKDNEPLLKSIIESGPLGDLYRNYHNLLYQEVFELNKKK